MTNRSIILRTETIRSTAVAAVTNLPIDELHPWEVLLRPYKAQRKLKQLGLYWIRLKDIETQAWIGGRQYSDIILHEHCKREYLPEVTDKGVHKWAYLPSGERTLAMGTGQLNVSEFALYMTQVEAFGAGLGVMFGEQHHANITL